MKNLFRVLVVISMMMAFTPSICNAQVTAGQYFLSGSAYVTNESKATSSGSTTTLAPSTTSIGVVPEVGYMVNDQWALMLGIGYKTTMVNNQKSGDNSEITATPSFILKPNVRRYLFSGQGGLYIDGGMELDFDSDQKKNGNTVTSQSAMRFKIGVGLGAAYFITERLMLNCKFAGVSFDTYTKEVSKDDKTQTNKFSLELNPLADLNLGLAFFF
jgi:hypothetical protein